ncbi:MAG: hypothetical protein SFV21_18785 [Rhodospirillaceae bacterium]|nr:hypothetical protein [Rhodospirillaceae bacterium]
MENKSGESIPSALERLTAAVDRLARAASDVPELRALESAHADLQARLADSERRAAILREAANRVASRLDHQIGRLGAALAD